MKRIAVIGATSAIAEETARIFAGEGAELFLVGRNGPRLESIAADLRVRGAGRVGTHILDLDVLDAHAQMLDQAQAFLGGIEAVLIAHGVLPDQSSCERDVGGVLESYQTNCLSVLSLLTLIGNRLRDAGGGCIAVISSVAGDRGRPTNYVYGSAKAAVTVFAEGLGGNLHRYGVRVVTVKPGLVDSPMTRDVAKNFLFSSPERVARSIHRAMHSGKPLVYVPSYWRWVMLVVRAIPAAVFKKVRF